MNKTILNFLLIAFMVHGAMGDDKPGGQSDSLSVDSTSVGPINQLDKMVVTATRTKRRMSETPASVSVIDAKKIVSSPAKNVDDLLQYETGVQVKRVVGIGEGVPMDIIIRGIPGGLVAARTLILVDGFPTNAAGTPFLILNEVPMHAIERVEVVRGPYSALYGANALGGVINIITRQGDGRPEFKGKIETSYPYTFGYEYTREDRERARKLARKSLSDTYWNTEALVEGGDERFNYMLSGGFRSVGNYLLRDSALVRAGKKTIYKSNENHDYSDIRVFGKFGTTMFDKLRLDIHTRFFDSELGFGLTRSTPEPHDVITQGQKLLIGPEVKFSMGESDIRIAGFLRRVTGQFSNEEEAELVSDRGDIYSDNVPSKWESVSDGGQFEGSITSPVGEMQNLTAGFDLLYNRISFGATLNRLNDDTIKSGVTESIYNVAAYVQDELDIGGRVSLLPGLRLDHHSVFGSVASPKFGIHVIVTDELGMRATAGKAFRAPTHTEMYMPDIRLQKSFIIQSNPDLVPETVWAFDLGMEYQPLENLLVKASGFYNKMNNLILPGIKGWDLKITHRNASEAWSRGVELETEWKANDYFSIAANGVLQQSSDQSMEKIRKRFHEKETEVSLDYVPNLELGTTYFLTKEFGSIPVTASLSLAYVGSRTYLDWQSVKVDPKYVEVVAGEELTVYVNPPVQELDPYLRVDLGVKAALTKNLELEIGIQNLLNQEYEEHGGTLAPGIFPTIGVTGSF